MSTFLGVEAIEIVGGLGLAHRLGLGPGPGLGHMRCVVRASPQGPALAEVGQPQVSLIVSVILKKYFIKKNFRALKIHIPVINFTI